MFPLEGGELGQHKAGGDPASSSASGRDMAPTTMSSREVSLPQGCQGTLQIVSSLGRNLLESGEPKRAQLLLRVPVSLSTLAQKAPDEPQPSELRGTSSAPAPLLLTLKELSVTDLFTIPLAMPFKCAKQDQGFFPRICTDRRCNLKRLNSVYFQPRTNQEEIN